MANKKVSDIRLNKVNARRTLCESIEAGGFVSINFDVPCNASTAVLLGMVKQDVELYSVDLFQDGDPGRNNSDPRTNCNGKSSSSIQCS